MKRSVIIVGLAVVLALVGCVSDGPRPSAGSGRPESDNPAASEPKSILDDKGNVTLYVSNQSGPEPLVDISVEVDDVSVASEEFDHGSGHTWKTYVLRLSPGYHQIKARSVKGDAASSLVFNVESKHWIALDYWYNDAEHGTPSPRQFSWHIQEEPIYFQ